MTCDKPTVTRSNFASRLLSKAMSERTKTVEISKPSVQETVNAPFSIEHREPAVAAK